MKRIIFFLLGFFWVLVGNPTLVRAETREWDIVAIEINKTKFWLPTQITAHSGVEFSIHDGMTLTVKKGDTVILHPKSFVEGANNIHGFAISEYKVAELVDGKGIVKHPDQAIRIQADRAGVFKIFCHLHPAHVGGVLKVEAAE